MEGVHLVLLISMMMMEERYNWEKRLILYQLHPLPSSFPSPLPRTLCLPPLPSLQPSQSVWARSFIGNHTHTSWTFESWAYRPALHWTALLIMEVRGRKGERERERERLSLCVLYTGMTAILLSYNKPCFLTPSYIYTCTHNTVLIDACLVHVITWIYFIFSSLFLLLLSPSLQMLVLLFTGPTLHYSLH